MIAVVAFGPEAIDWARTDPDSQNLILVVVRNKRYPKSSETPAKVHGCKNWTRLEKYN